jgi:hypothetical protein
MERAGHIISGNPLCQILQNISQSFRYPKSRKSGLFHGQHMNQDISCLTTDHAKMSKGVHCFFYAQLLDVASNASLRSEAIAEPNARKFPASEEGNNMLAQALKPASPARICIEI